jgi:hypothetical protein
VGKYLEYEGALVRVGGEVADQEYIGDLGCETSDGGS